jgi:predicted dehydrogenase
VNALGIHPEENSDNMSILLRYENGSNAVVNYFGNGSKAYPKERIEVFYQEKVLVLDNWRKLKGYGFRGFSSMTGSLDKGHTAEFALLKERTQNGGEPLIPFDELVNATEASFACITSLKEKRWVNLNEITAS